MAVKQGYFGKVVFAGANAGATTNAYSWSLTYEAGEGETTEFPTSTPTLPHPKEFLPLSTEWSGSFNVRLDATTAMVAPGVLISELKLYVDQANTFGYKGDAFIKSISPGVDVNGVPECTVNFRGTGVLTIGNIG
jgi:hypothetical protein